MFCTNCGNQIPDNSAFCPNCGTILSAPAQQPQQPVYQQPVYQQPAYPQQPAYQQPAYPQQPNYNGYNNGYGAPNYGQPVPPVGEPPRSVGFGEAIKICFNKYATFSGRASKSEFWWFYLFTFLVSFTVIGAFACLIPMIAVGIRRLHDTGKSGWYYLLSLIPYVGGIIVIILMCKDSVPADNEYGPGPQPVYNPYGAPYQPYQ